jgi:hypothetical protein
MERLGDESSSPAGQNAHSGRGFLAAGSGAANFKGRTLRRLPAEFFGAKLERRAKARKRGESS